MAQKRRAAESLLANVSTASKRNKTKGRAKGEKAALTGGPVPEQEECIGLVEDNDVETCSPPSGVVVPEQREENGDDDSLHESDPLAAKMDSLSQPVGKKEAKVAAGLYRPVTREELQTLKETENLFRSNLLKLQIGELLSEVAPVKDQKNAALEEYLKTLREFLASLPQAEEISLDAALSCLPKGVTYPLPLDASCSKGRFSFDPPSSIKVVGSWLLKTHFRKQFSIDLAVEIPESCLQEKDYLNHRYFHKRTLYLSQLAQHLRKSGLCTDLQFCAFQGDPLRPILCLTPTGEGLSSHSIRLLPFTPRPLTKLIRLAPNRNCVREVKVGKRTLQAERTGDDVVSPTPHYNNSLIVETTGLYTRHMEAIFVAAQTCEAFTDTVLLLRVWLRQRQLDQGHGGVSGFLCSMLLAHMLEKKKVSGLMSSYQMLRVVWTYLMTSDWTREGDSMAAGDEADRPTLAAFHAAFQVVFVDPSGWCNLTANMSTATYKWLQHEAARAMQLLDDSAVNGFEALFMSPVSFVEKFDMLCHVDLTSLVKAHTSGRQVDYVTSVLDCATGVQHRVVDAVVNVLVEGLGKRATLVAVKPDVEQCWPVAKKPLSPGNHVTLGVLLDSDHTFMVLHRGPSADSREATDFRKFWGDKSQMRRFQDGSINEAILWAGATAAERRTIPQQIVVHLLERHCGIAGTAVCVTTTAAEPLIALQEYSTTSSKATAHESSLVATGEELQQDILQAFSELGEELRHLSGLPLAVNSLQGASPAFRYTQVFPPLQWNGRIGQKSHAEPTCDVQVNCFYPSPDGVVPRHTPALEVVCQMESSGKWPDELDAISQVKTAFYCAMAEQLGTECKLVTSPTGDYMDVLKKGFVFRVRIGYEREVLLMRDELKYKNGEEGKEFKAAVQRADRDVVHRPKLTAALAGLHHLFPAFGGAARLAKRWISAQMFANHITEEAVDLIVASIFVNPAPYMPPATPTCAFVRFLKLLSTFDWQSAPLVVNMNNELAAETFSEIQSNFTTHRESLPAMFIATPLEKAESIWTESRPAPPILAHMRRVATKAYDVLSAQLDPPTRRRGGEGEGQLPSQDLKLIFRPSLKTFDLLIHLRSKHLSRRHLAVDPTPSTSTSTSTLPPRPHPSHMPVVDFDPVTLYLRELEESYSEFVVFFHDHWGGSVIGGVWRPQLADKRPFKVLRAQCLKEVVKTGKKRRKSEGPEYTVDVEAILEDFKVIGHGLVSSVEVLNYPLPSN